MRHGDKVNNLGRKKAHRQALLQNLTTALIRHKRINTTLAKAKALRVYAEPIITRSKTDSQHNRRVVFSHLQDKEAVTELFTVIGDKVANRPGGYTRIIKLPRRVSDAADMAMIELVDFNEIYNQDGDKGAKKTRRSRRSGGGKKKTAAKTETAVAEETNEEATATMTEEAPKAEATPKAEAPKTEDAPAKEENNEEKKED